MSIINNANKDNFTNHIDMVQDLRTKTKDNFEKMNNSLFEAFENIKCMISIVNQELSSSDVEQQKAIELMNQKLASSLDTVDKMKYNLDKSMKEKKVKKKIKQPIEGQSRMNTLQINDPSDQISNISNCENVDKNVNEINDESNKSESSSESDSDSGKYKRSNSVKMNDADTGKLKLNLNLRQKTIDKRQKLNLGTSTKIDNMLKKDLFSKVNTDTIKRNDSIYKNQYELNDIDELNDLENEKEETNPDFEYKNNPQTKNQTIVVKKD